VRAGSGPVSRAHDPCGHPRARREPFLKTERDKSPALSVLTALFLHGGWLHLLGNLLFLLIFGNNVEDRLGHIRFLLFYVACGYAATYAFAYLNDTSPDPLIGASGAIAGVLGAYLVLYPRVRVWILVPFLLFLPLRLPAWIVLGFWFGLQAVYSSGEGVSGAGTVAYAAHVVGFLAGMLIAWPLRAGTTPPPEPRGLIFGRHARPRW
jgi:membrane associated rhomboid family serine protease